jgi:hypothetical protein
MDRLKEAFQKIRDDMDFLKEEMHSFRFEIISLKQEIQEINLRILNSSSEISRYGSSRKDVDSTNPSTQNPLLPTSSTNPSTHNILLKPQNTKIMPFSTGNEGVPTDKQTNRQTDKQQDFGENTVKNASEILESLDNLKKEIRLKFKRLTDQEWVVFSTIYQLEDEMGFSDYKSVSERLKLTESSIRDYVGRLIKKGIPVDKIKINNKNIQLSISSNLKKIATLPTILHLRDL